MLQINVLAAPGKVGSLVGDEFVGHGAYKFNEAGAPRVAAGYVSSQDDDSGASVLSFLELLARRADFSLGTSFHVPPCCIVKAIRNRNRRVVESERAHGRAAARKS